jgi:hypothetical protein
MIERHRLWTQVETVFHEGGPVPDKPQKKGALAIVLTNPFAGRYEEHLLDFMEELKPLGVELAQQLVDAMGCTVDQIEGYGKGAIVGANGELEHGALWHVPGGYGMRQILGYQEGKAGGGASSVDQESRWARHPTRCTDYSYQRELCSGPFRRDGSGHSGPPACR